MLLRRLWLTDFRSYEQADVTLAPGLTAVLGPNGQGKTNLLEAIGWVAMVGSFRGAPNDALIRAGCERAVVRAEGVREGRELLIEAELTTAGRNRVLVNRQRLARARDLLGALRVTVFSPDDLTLVKGAPAERRRYLDDTLVALHPRYDQLRADVDRILRQRGALLKQCAGGSRLDDTAAHTLDVWDAKLAESGSALAQARLDLVDRLAPVLALMYASVAPEPVAVDVFYDAPWMDADGGLAGALAAARKDELRRGVNLVGPHRDELLLLLGGMPTRSHASQGEQRSLALALRLAAHSVVTATAETTPVLLLDDVFSELDPVRSDGLLRHLPEGQTILTSASGLPPGAEPDLVLHVDGSKIVDSAP